MQIYSNNLAHNLSEHLQKHNQLEKIIDELIFYHGLIPRIGIEIEFYLSQDVNIEKFKELIKIELKKEKGTNQFEIDLPPTTNLITYIKKIKLARENIKISAIKAEGSAYLEAKPYPNDYGNSMHFHLDFIGDFNFNLSANSLCHYMLETFLVFMPNVDDYLRIDKNFMTPTHVARGKNNRTLAIRVPDSLPKRLEYRIASPLCDPYLAIFAILKVILLGLKNPDNIKQHPVIYGNAFDPQYKLTPLPRTIEEAKELFNQNIFNLLGF